MSSNSDNPPPTTSPFLRSAQIIADDLFNIEQDHSDKPLGKKERARIWRHTNLSGIELFHGVYQTYSFARHFHTVPAIGVVDAGTMSSYCRKTTYVLPAGTILLLNPGEVHAPGPAGASGWSFRVLYLEEALLREWSTSLGAGTLRFAKPFVQDRALAANLLCLHRKLENTCDTLELEATLLLALSQLTQRHAMEPAKLAYSKTEPTKIKRIKDYLHAHYQQNVTLDALAAIAEFSPYHLLRAFRKEIGLTPHAFLTQVRIEQAKRLLLKGCAIAEIAARTGFTDQSHFTRHFKKLTGITPGQYLPQLRYPLQDLYSQV